MIVKGKIEAGKAAHKRTWRIGVAFVDAPHLAKEAVTYTIVQQNRLQTTFEFGACDLGMIPRLPSDAAWETYHAAVRDRLFAGPYDPRDKWLAVTELPFKDRFYLHGDNGQVEILSLADWNRVMAPPSVIEFVLAMSQRACIDAVAPEIVSHRVTRGCLHDFNRSLRDARFMVLTSTLCASCRQAIAEKAGSQALNDLLKLTDRAWLGKMKDPTSVVCTLKKAFKNDVYITKGLSPTWWERAERWLAPGFFDTVWKIVLTVLLFILAVRFGIRAGAP